MYLADLVICVSQGGGTGHLDIQFTGNPLAGEDAGCTAGISWPSIESIRIMGVASVDTSSVTTQVCAAAHEKLWCCDAARIYGEAPCRGIFLNGATSLASAASE